MCDWDNAWNCALQIHYWHRHCKLCRGRRQGRAEGLKPPSEVPEGGPKFHDHVMIGTTRTSHKWSRIFGRQTYCHLSSFAKQISKNVCYLFEEQCRNSDVAAEFALWWSSRTVSVEEALAYTSAGQHHIPMWNSSCKYFKLWKSLFTRLKLVAVMLNYLTNYKMSTLRLPAITVSVERTFPMLRRLNKTWLRSAMFELDQRLLVL